jgi:stearoyl-CoA desaturase (Delta-9 desaturase)
MILSHIFDNLLGILNRSQILKSLFRWIDSDAIPDEYLLEKKGRIDWFRIMPFMGLHVMCLAVVFTGWSWTAVNTAFALYLIRIFSITAFYHRYFSHRSFKTNRAVQFVFALLGNSALQRGPLRWAANHRHHHRYSDTEEDFHSPARQGFLWAHIGWFLSYRNFKTRHEYVKDWMAYPELIWLNRFDMVVPIILAVVIFLIGVILAAYAPGLGTNGPQMLVWGFFISTVATSHATFFINSFDHMFGSQRYKTGDTSRNNWILAILLLGEGWHNNHHHYAVSTRNGFFWWEIDITYYLIFMLSLLGIVSDIRPVPESVLNSDRLDKNKMGSEPVSY